MEQTISSAMFSQLVSKNEITALEEKNISFKYMLAEALMVSTHKEQLGQFEYFQNRFLQLDEKIGLLKADIQLSENLPELPGEAKNKQLQVNNIKIFYDGLYQEIEYLEREFKKFLLSQTV